MTSGIAPQRLPRALFFLLLAACAGDSGAGSVRAATAAGAEFTSSSPGIEVLLRDSIHLVRGRKLGLITNHTGLGSGGTSTIDLLAEHPDVELVALFSPEHGIRGDVAGGNKIDSSVDEATGLPIHSLYGDTRKPTPDMLRGLEVLAFDIQDVGARYYTYVSTMALAMEAAGEQGIPFLVLDRPNPLGGVLVQGNVLDPAFASFVGMFPVPMRHGMTPGELARMMVGEYGVSVDLAVVPVEGWRRSDSFVDTGLPWVPPSPNMPSLESALHYPGTCLFEGTNLSVGRGTALPFQQVGAPWLDGSELARRLRNAGLRDVRFDAVTFTPSGSGDGKYEGEEVHGVRLTSTGTGYDPTETAIAILIEARRLAGSRWSWRESHFDRLAGTDRVRAEVDAGAPLSNVVSGWAEARALFLARREPYLLYP